MLPILARAKDCAEKADALYKQMYNFIWEEYERGKSDIAEEGWNGIVRPLEEQAYSYKDVKQKAETNGKEAFFTCRIRNVPLRSIRSCHSMHHSQIVIIS